MSELEKTLIEEIKQIIDITSRVDERVKMIVDNQQQIGKRLDHFIDEHNELVAKVYVIEAKNGHKAQEMIGELDDKVSGINSRMDVFEAIGSKKNNEMMLELGDEVVDLRHKVKDLEEHKTNISEKVKVVFNHIVQGLFFIAIAYILYKLGLNPPPGQ